MTNKQLRQLIRSRHNEIIQAFNDVYTERDVEMVLDIWKQKHKYKL